MTRPVAIVLGAGKRIGSSVGEKLKKEGYNVALVSRSGESKEGYLSIQADVTDATQLSQAFDKTEAEFGDAISVVVFNVAKFTQAPTQGDPFSVPYDAFTQDLVTGSNSAYPAIQRSLQGFRKLSASVPKIFIATSNLLDTSPADPVRFTLGAQKRGLAYLVETAATAYAQQGFRFYVASQVSPTGSFPGQELSGEAHGIAYWNLIQKPEQGRYDFKFLKDGSVFSNY